MAVFVIPTIGGIYVACKLLIHSVDSSYRRNDKTSENLNCNVLTFYCFLVLYLS